jgi:cytochrome c553
VDGLGRGQVAAFPKIAGQSPEYIEEALRAFAKGERKSGIMGPIAASLTEAEWKALATYYSALPRQVPTSLGSLDRIQRGREISERGIPDKMIPSCKDCHGPGTERRNSHYPNLGGQYADYLVLELELFKAGRRGGSSYAPLMEEFAGRLTREEMLDVAAYYASLRPHSEKGGK